jgi:hypothetical protein
MFGPRTPGTPTAPATLIGCFRSALLGFWFGLLTDVPFILRVETTNP